MKNSLYILGITIVLVIICGCTQSSAPVQPTATMTVTAQNSVIPTVPVTQIQTTNLVSENTVRINNLAFNPANITVKAGSIVRWVNGDSVPHRIQFDDKHFSTILLGASQSVSQKFVEPGVYPYISLTHPEMHGTVIVE
ncbi:MAG: cupredoxin domain-containing protein [Methanoregula sp.]|jgi:plastocyanin|nr:cupredoxin domain-containing protein [Methanoregula sp.]